MELEPGNLIPSSISLSISISLSAVELAESRFILWVLARDPADPPPFYNLGNGRDRCSSGKSRRCFEAGPAAGPVSRWPAPAPLFFFSLYLWGDLGRASGVFRKCGFSLISSIALCLLALLW